MTPGFSGADLENVCNEAAIAAAREKASSVTKRHFGVSLERVQFGLKNTEILDAENKHQIAVYESGKALSSWMMETLAPVIKLSILETSKTKT